MAVRREVTGALLLPLVLVGVAASAAPGAPGAAGAMDDALAAALSRHSAADVEALRARRDDDVPTRCTLGAVYAARGDVVRASFFLAGCLDAELADSIAVRVRTAAREIARRVDDGDLAEVVLSTRPDGVVVETDAMPGERFAPPRVLWVKPGTYSITATTTEGRSATITVVTEAGKRTPAYLDAVPATPVTAPGDPRAVDFSEEVALEPPVVAPPPAVKHKSLIRGRYARDLGETTSPAIADPLARPPPGPRALRTTWLGLRAGIGAYDDGAGAARVSSELAIAGRFAIAPRWFVTARVDYSLRGRADLAPRARADVGGLSAGLGLNLVRTQSLRVAASAALRAELRPGSATGGLALNLDLSPLATPLTVGLRFEPTPSTGALLLELGLDLR